MIKALAWLLLLLLIGALGYGVATHRVWPALILLSLMMVLLLGYLVHGVWLITFRG